MMSPKRRMNFKPKQVKNYTIAASENHSLNVHYHIGQWEKREENKKENGAKEKEKRHMP